MRKTLLKQRGQSMTEFTIAAAFVLVPLFIIVPTVGKYIDMKLATTQAARYSSWEYTANYIDLKDQPGGFSAFNSSQLPLKSNTQVANEAKRRFFSDTSLVLSSSKDKAGFDYNERNLLWTYHNGLPMYDEGNAETLSISGSDKTPDKVGISYIFGFVGSATKAVGNLLQAFGLNVGFDAMNPDETISIDGSFNAQLSIPVEEAPTYTALKTSNKAPLFGQDLDLKMTAKSGILTESWGAGGKAHTVFQTGGLIPTVLLSGLVQDILDVISFVAPSLHSSSLKFGYPANDPDVMDEVPVGALDNDTRSLNCRGGYCED